jgi:hypothetical protein
MKKFIIALMCATVSVAAVAQPQKENQKCDKPMCCQDMCCGIDSTTMKTVMELKKKYRENYRKELRQTLGDEKYIQYLEYKVAKKERKAMRKAMKHRRGMAHQRGGQWRMRGQHRMMHPGFQSRGNGYGQKFEGGMKKDDFKGNKDKDKNKDKNKDKKKDNKKDNKK